jgi:hypothetical protein
MKFPKFHIPLFAGLLLLVSAIPLLAAPEDLLFTVEIDGSDPNFPKVFFTNNSPVLEISRVEFTIGDTSKNFDGKEINFELPPGAAVSGVTPGPTARGDVFAVNLTGFDPGETFSVTLDVDRDTVPEDSVENFATVFYNNQGAPNSVVTVFSGAAKSATRILPDNPDPNNLVFRGPGRLLRVFSTTEDEPEFIKGVVVKRDGVQIRGVESPTADFGNIEVAHGDRIEVIVPKEVFKNIHSEYISNSGANSGLGDENAEERFESSGMSVNNVPQTADPTLLDFQITTDTDVTVKWNHYYALTISQDFSKTRSQDLINGEPWAGPLESDAAGAPDPPVSKQWVLRGTQPVVQIDGQNIDNLSHPGLDFRYVVKGYRAYGPPNSQVSSETNKDRFLPPEPVDIRKPQQGTVSGYADAGGKTRVTNFNNVAHGLKDGNFVEITGSDYAPYNGLHKISGVTGSEFVIDVQPADSTPVALGLWRNATYVRTINFPSVEQRQQIKPNFSMYGPGGITYVWQIQYGVRLSIDDPSRGSLPKVYQVTDANTRIDKTVKDGVAWFDPGSRIEVVTAAEDSDTDGLSLTGWISGDGYYFSDQGQVDPVTQLPSQGAPAVVNGSPVARWITDGPNNSLGYRINNLQRPVKVFWRYGAGAIAVNVMIGKHVFENYPGLATTFYRQPDPIVDAKPADIATPAGGSAPNGELMAEWDPVSARLFPTIPGTFTVPWKPGDDSQNAVEIRVTSTLPFDPQRGINGHYPHILGAPPVALDPDPNDDFKFKSIKYSTSEASVDADKLFNANRTGFSVLLFSQIQRSGRGQPRETLQVRVVDTRSWDKNLPANPTTKTVGQKITDPGVDLANLGTGYVFDPNDSGRARYNPFIYDGQKMSGLAARDIYDMTKLRADNSSLVVVNKGVLPGPVIPVNEQPGAADQDLPVIIWYDDPRRNDLIMWPLQSRIYRPAWPSASSVPQIVIASQFGSDGKSRNNEEQQTAPAIGDFPAATTYDPSRLQSVQIYSQPIPDSPGYNPNEEHGLVAPSLRFSDVSPRPPAIYALRDGDLNNKDKSSPGYTSDPFVLAQFYDVADDEVKMKVYSVRRESSQYDSPRYRFGDFNSTALSDLRLQSFVKMFAGEPVIPFYPLGVAIGASSPAETFGNNLFPQEVYWEDWRNSSWSISGGNKAWFVVSFYYPLAPDFWWPGDLKVPPVKVTKNGAQFTASFGDSNDVKVPQVGDSVSFLPVDAKAAADAANFDKHLPKPVLYKSEWPDNPPVLKAGETLTFQGGEYRADNPTSPGLPQVLAFASAEVVFDSLNPEAKYSDFQTQWTARVVQALDRRTAPLSTVKFPASLQPATGATTVKKGKYVFNGLSASLQRRLRYDPLAVRLVNGVQVPGVLEFIGLVNDKDIGEPTLTAAPPAVYVLEPNILTEEEKNEILDLVPTSNATERTNWETAVNGLYTETRNPEGALPLSPFNQYLVGLTPNPPPVLDAQGNEVVDPIRTALSVFGVPQRAYGPGLALVPNGNFLNPNATYPDESWVTVMENNDPAFGGSPITPHIIRVDRNNRYRGSVKIILSDNVFDENIILRSTGDFGANPADLVFEWWYRPDDGSENVPPPSYISPGETNPWKLFPDPSGKNGLGRYQITLKGNPNAPETLLADTFWFLRYRHRNDTTSGTNWEVAQNNGSQEVNYTWAGAGNSQPFVDADLDGIPDFRAQLAQGWIKRVLDAVNPYEARIRDFEGDSPSTLASMVAQFGSRYEGAVALNPDKNVIENVGLIELYQTVLNRGLSLSVNLSRPVSTPAISNALQLASTRLSDFYTLLGNEAYADAGDPTIGFGSNSVEYGSLSTSVFAFQNQLPSPISEELVLLRGVDDFFARPVYNRLFWNFTKGEGEAAYANNYNITDITGDGFIDESDAMKLFPQGHGDAWGHYLTALRGQYGLLGNKSFNWVSRSESYNLQDIVITVDFLDERKFAATAAAKAKVGAEIVSMTYRDSYVADPNAQWQGYTDSNPDRAWGVDEWSRRGGQGAYFDWVTANALLPSQHPNKTLEGVRKVDRRSNGDIAVISANLNAIQRTIDQADQGDNPLGLASGAQVFDLEPAFIENASGGDRRSHFDQIAARASDMLENATSVWDNANQRTNLLRQVGNSEEEFRNSTFQEDLSYRNQLIEIFGKPYEGNIGPGKLYPAGYEGPDLGLYMYVPVREINKSTVPGPTTDYAVFNGSGGALSGGALYSAFQQSADTGYSPINKETALNEVSTTILNVFAPTFASATNSLKYDSNTTSGLFAVNYTDLNSPKVNLTNFTNRMPITAAGYTFQAPPEWGARGASGELQGLINQMIQQEAQVAQAIGAWDGLTGETVRILQLINARLTLSGRNLGRDQIFNRVKNYTNDAIKVIETARGIVKSGEQLASDSASSIAAAIPTHLPTVGFAISPGDALAPARGGVGLAKTGTLAALKSADGLLAIGKLIAEISLDIAETELTLTKADEERTLQIKEWVKELEDKVGDEPVLRIAIFKEIEALRALSNQYRTLIDKGGRLIDERAAFNKRVSAQTQRNRYQDMTFRVSRNHALTTYRSSFDLASRYVYLAAAAYDYETNYSLDDPASPANEFGSIIKARTTGSLKGALNRLKANHEARRSQLGLNNAQREVGDISMRREFMRILSPGETQPATPANELPSPGEDSDSVWKNELQKAQVPDLWQIPEFRQHCRPFAAANGLDGKPVPQPGIVLRFSSDISSGKNFFGKPLSGGDHAYSTSNYATKIFGVGVTFDGYQTDDVLRDLAATPRVYFVPAGMDIMRVSRTDDFNQLRTWKVVEQSIPVPFPATSSKISESGYIPLLDALDGRFGDQRKFSDFRAYPASNPETTFETRLLGRSIWNTQWLLIIPGATLNADPEVGLKRFVEQVSDIKLIFDTYGQSGG